jgi:hypothetical protein
MGPLGPPVQGSNTLNPGHKISQLIQAKGVA